LIEESVLDGRGRFNLAWIKPISPVQFFLKEDVKTSYDLCIGSSYIHDKKAQWKVIDALTVYLSKYKTSLKCVMPGVFRHGVKTNRIPYKIQSYGLDIDFPGMISRTALNELYNSSKMYIHLGGGGQNDRGPLEALVCGCVVMIESPKRHAPFLRKAPSTVRIAKDGASPEAIADDIHDMLTCWATPFRRSANNFFNYYCDPIAKILPDMEKLFNVIKANRPPAPFTLVEEFREKQS